MAHLTDLGFRCVLCDAIVKAFGKSTAGNTTGGCTVSIKGNVLTVKAGTTPWIATIEMTFTHSLEPDRPSVLRVTRAASDPNLLQMSGQTPMTVDALAAHVVETFIAALQAH